MAPGSHAIRPSVASQRDQVSSHSSGCSAGNSTCRARRAGAPVSAPEPLPRYRVPCRAPGSGRQGRVGTARGAHLFAERALRGQAARAHAQRRAAQRRDRLALPEWEEGRVRQHQHLARRAARRSAKAGSALARAAGGWRPRSAGLGMALWQASADAPNWSECWALRSTCGRCTYTGALRRPAFQQRACSGLQRGRRACGGASGTCVRAGPASAACSQASGACPRATSTAPPTMCRIWCSMNEAPATVTCAGRAARALGGPTLP